MSILGVICIFVLVALVIQALDDRSDPHAEERERWRKWAEGDRFE